VTTSHQPYAVIEPGRDPCADLIRRREQVETCPSRRQLVDELRYLLDAEPYASPSTTPTLKPWAAA
jgi:hypothetical protein